MSAHPLIAAVRSPPQSFRDSMSQSFHVRDAYARMENRLPRNLAASLYADVTRKHNEEKD